MKRSLKIAGIAALVLVTLASLLVAVWLSVRKDWIEPLPGVRLEPFLPVLLEKDIDPEDAFGLLLQAQAALRTQPTLDCRDAVDRMLAQGADWSASPDLLEALEDNAEALHLAKRAAEKGNGQVPTADLQATLPYLAWTKSLADLLGTSAALKAGQGDEAGALDDLDSAIHLGQILSRGGTVIHHLVDIACTERACMTLRRIALRKSLAPQTSRSALERLKEGEARLEPIPEILRFEAVYGLSALKMLKPGGGAGAGMSSSVPVALVTADTGRNLANCYAHLIHIAESPYKPHAFTAFEARLTQPQGWRICLKKDPVGLILANLLMPTAGKAQCAHLRCLATLRATQAVLAVRQFQARTGLPPKDLDELVKAGDLPEVPMDPFDGKPLRYALDPDGSWRIYSVGMNAVDDGGIGSPVNPTAGDLVFTSRELEELRAKLAKIPPAAN